MKWYIKSNYATVEIYDAIFISPDCRNAVINCAVNRQTVKNILNRVKSSNVWAFGMDRDSINTEDDTGDLVVQFKNKTGGPGDIYIYYDVPTALYRKWVTTPSKGAWFWKNIRHRFFYSKLTGNKRGVLPNAIN